MWIITDKSFSITRGGSGGGCKILGNRMVFRGNGEGISRHQQSINGRRGGGI